MVALTKLRYFEKLSNPDILFQQTLGAPSEYGNKKIKHFNTDEKAFVAELLLEICLECGGMAAIPQGAFAACKLSKHYRERDLIIARMRSGGERNDNKIMIENKKLMEYNPHKYNDKLMNSIWGFYNRYSPHNIKGNEYELAKEKDNQQQQDAVANYTLAKKLAMGVFSDQCWSFKKN